MQQHGKGSSLASRQQLFSLVSFGPSSDEGPVSSLPFSPPLPWRCSYCSSVSCSPLWNASSVSVFKRNVKPGPTLPTWTFDFYDLDICFAVGFVTLDTFLSQARIAKNRKTWFSLFRICSITAGTRQEHTGPNAEHLKRLGRLRWILEQICLVCSAVLEAFGTVSLMSGQIQLAESESVGSQRIGRHRILWLVVC